MDYYQLSASAFADKIKIPRSSISHLLSGRNKPSLDFVLKIINKFDTVELYWLLKDEGYFPKENDTSPNPIPPPKETNTKKGIKPPDAKKTVLKNSKQIEKIVLFYTDGTFKEYIN